MGKTYYKHRCEFCDKKAVEKNGDIYLCKIHRSRKLDSNKVYTARDLREVRFVEEIQK